ncbi:MAG: branched-chain amino acid transaminase, partial [bacterium]|nr:branched-chain amino acid transaminase [bacterium]
EANIHVLTYTLHYSLGAFEGIRCYQCDDGSSAIFRLKEHIDRLYNSCHVLGIKVPFEKEKIMESCLEIFRVNKLKHGYLRPIVFIGDGEMGLIAYKNPVRVALAAWPWGSYLGDEGVKNGIRAKVSSFTRHSVNSTMSKAKGCSTYTNSIMAKQEAIQCGYEEAILLDAEGYVAEASGENIFLVKEGIVKTTPSGASILEGITARSVIKILRDKKIEVRQQKFTRDELYLADEVFLTGTAAEITPIREIDNRTVATGKPGPVTQEVQKTFFDIVHGNNKTYRDWLDFI